MITPPELFKTTKEFVVVSVILILIIVIRLFFEYQNYQNLKELKDFYYTDAQVVRIYKNDNNSALLRLHSKEGFDFYINSKKAIPKHLSWVRVKLKLKKDTNFLDYLRGFFAYGDIIESIEDGVDPKEYFRKQIDKQHDTSLIVNKFYHAIFLADPLDKDIREKVSLLGASHLVALSGFHLGVLWLIIFALVYIPYRFIQQKYMPWRHRSIDIGFIALIFLGIFVLFTGSAPSIVRSYVMLLIAWSMLYLGLELFSFKLLIITVLLILAIEPSLITSIGLILSIAGVFYIFLLLKWFRGSSKLFITLIAIPFGLFFLMYPIGHIFFYETSIWQLASPVLSLLFVIFYPISAVAHLFGFGNIFDDALVAIYELPNDSVTVIMPIYLIIIYVLLSIISIFSKKAFYATLIFSILITAWHMWQ